MPEILTKAIQGRKVNILDNIEQFQPTTIKRLNPSLYKNYKDELAKIEVPKNPDWPIINIHKDYRLLSTTTNIEKLNKLSPAFINSFDIIILEDQLKEIENNDNKQLKTHSPIPNPQSPNP